MRRWPSSRTKRAGADADALRAAVEAFNRATGPFAERRMDRGVQRALAGKRLDSLV
jgi:molecular chaperone HscA